MPRYISLHTLACLTRRPAKASRKNIRDTKGVSGTRTPCSTSARLRPARRDYGGLARRGLRAGGTHKTWRASLARPLRARDKFRPPLHRGTIRKRSKTYFHIGGTCTRHRSLLIWGLSLGALS